MSNLSSQQNSQQQSNMAWVAPVVAGVASLVGSGVNAASQSSANRANLAAVEAQNRSNERIAEKNNWMQTAQFNTNLQWLKEQFAKQHEYDLQTREYNSPINQRNRYLAAGINPYYAMGNGSPAAVNSVGSVGAPSQSNFHTPHMEAGHVDPVQFDFTGLSESIGESVNSYFRNQLLNEQTKKARFDTQIQRAIAVTQMSKSMNELREQTERIEKLIADKNVSKEQKELYKVQQHRLQQEIDLIDTQWNDLSVKEKTQNQYVDAMTRNQRASALESEVRTQLLNIEKQWKPLLNQASLRLSSQQSAHLAELVKLTAQQTCSELNNTSYLGLKNTEQQFKNKLIQYLQKDERWKQLGKDGMRPLLVFTDLLGDMLFGNVGKLFK